MRFFVGILLLLPLTLVAETAYVTDTLQLGMHQATDTSDRPFRNLDSGQAMASLSEDLHHASTQGVKGSPTWVLNEGRQQLYGNVGYRILSANIDELLNNPADEASWC